MWRFLLEQELPGGDLQSIASRNFHKLEQDLVVARRRDQPQVPVCNRPWTNIKEEPPAP